MLRSNQVSLNAVRVFATVAECSSFKLAAVRLAVTPGAVSRQVLKLEATLGVQLFQRSSNAIHLTEIGDVFLRQVRSGMHIIDHAIERIVSDDREVTVKVPTTLAIRWLIPLLSEFGQRWPDLSVRIETDDGSGQTSNTRADVTVAYVMGSRPPNGADVLIEDRCRPYLAPSLLSRIADPADLSCIPALQCTHDNWDWEAWMKESTFPDVQLQFDSYFDLDDAALRAAISGMGMVLASEVIVRDDLTAGRLCTLPNSPEVCLAHYILQTPYPTNAATDTFVRWLQNAAREGNGTITAIS